MKIVVHIEGGAVQSILSDGPAEVRVIDYDTSMDDPESVNIRAIEFSDGSTDYGYVFDWTEEAEVDREWVDKIFALPPSK